MPSPNPTTRIAAVGDLVVLRHLDLVERQRSGTPNPILSLLQESDFSFGNMEVPLTRVGYPSAKRVTLRVDPEVAPDLAAAGFNMLSVANNHCLDYGYDGLESTMAALGEQGVATVGGGLSSEQALAPRWGTGAAARVAVIAFTCLIPLNGRALPGKPGVYGIRVTTSYEIDADVLVGEPGFPPRVHTVPLATDQAELTALIAQVRAEADVVLVSAHWGLSFQTQTIEYQRGLGQACIDAGADAVVGHHTHVFQGVELYRGRPIFHSLGTFIFHDQASALVKNPPKNGLLARLQLGKDQSLEFEVVPYMLDRGGEPTAASPDEREQMLSELERLSRNLGTDLALRAGPVRL